MKASFYNGCTAWLNRTPRRSVFFRVLFRLLPIVTAVSYLLMLVGLFWLHREKFLLFFGVPAFVFLSVTILRKALNITRPYDQMDYTPFLPADKGKGKSFPSRHTASAAAIACAFFYLSPLLGCVFWILAVCVAVSRVVSGMHTFADVIAGILFPLPFALLYLL
ncbi:MAG TPA: phosphatase PAP2 family protein [Candidatus Gallacutalibacter pullistercoris]|nr:phosphatase PAP2 family protein [Candidatus Gallacutalibacter pullistercoris]